MIKANNTRSNQPINYEVNDLIKHYKENGKLDRPIIISAKKEKYLLEDNYLRLYVAKKLGLKKIDAVIGTFEESQIVDKLCKVGTKLIDKKHGKGEIVSFNYDKITILFKDAKEIKFSIFNYSRNKKLKLL